MAGIQGQRADRAPGYIASDPLADGSGTSRNAACPHAGRLRGGRPGPRKTRSTSFRPVRRGCAPRRGVADVLRRDDRLLGGARLDRRLVAQPDPSFDFSYLVLQVVLEEVAVSHCRRRLALWSRSLGHVPAALAPS